MTLSPKYRNLLRVGVGITLAFIYIPLLVIAIYAFNGGTTLKWPLDSVTTHWFGDAIRDHAARTAFLTSIKVGVAATAIALVLGTLASFAVARHRFFGRETVSFLVVIPIALPGIVTGLALSDTFTQVLGVTLGLFTVIVAHATFCIVVIYNNVIARLRRVSANLEEASADLGAHTWQTFRHITLPTCRLRSSPAHCSPSHSRSTRSSSPRSPSAGASRPLPPLDPRQPVPGPAAADHERGRGDRRPALDHPGLPRAQADARGEHQHARWRRRCSRSRERRCLRTEVPLGLECAQWSAFAREPSRSLHSAFRWRSRLPLTGPDSLSMAARRSIAAGRRWTRIHAAGRRSRSGTRR